MKPGGMFASTMVFLASFICCSPERRFCIHIYLRCIKTMKCNAIIRVCAMCMHGGQTMATNSKVKVFCIATMICFRLDTQVNVVKTKR